ncbi:hypothetical protein A3B52_00940 [Candidatus Curtissbacteria bacterium RIFCSPLOWO2_01_FULL_41_28]|uniref:HIT domain-containing protein n=1 Tax=Candidatus Curtissbacteria bacterium RIFOXYA1_FULL_41_14 TaxID=1797737 RepID=A0A1F5HEL9_9BACT|nr:MAG: hypothetical protein A2683_02955 [Candidatus Curtissbacteria bacterium RIFCSPHIGHO2_01_FULL_34_40]OGD91650.1 MAG: hypothetical protein A3E14_03005 [Candidatus Curtissbacteria bacterium RIFCSPHIGHO2_12_FULL_41_13]OGD96260.1 MAG: hypothetical protein A3B52_00940 [Candidatus Curtissbacteria bacterium RIFCSPLOWO2_01_FULL_41_28]OGE02530.1 MAG: hypothetical protein A2196_01540 [Candidatus Curtissbacteria bacterium RIFOXYA1_FULL_41_14]OGE05816.1 MAG: hypothetical protein A2362_03000 [Candidatu
MTSKDCIFCKIIKGEIKVEPIIESKLVIAFNDTNPVAATHILIVPKKHIESVATIEDSDADEIIEMFSVANKIVRERKLSAYRLTFNGGSYQHVGHLHMHLLAGGKIEWSRL